MPSNNGNRTICVPRVDSMKASTDKIKREFPKFLY